MEPIELIVPEGIRERLDHFLATKLPDTSRTKVQNWCKDGIVFVEGEPRKSSHIIHAGDLIAIDVPEEPELENLTPEDIPLDVIYEDETIILINKPAGMVVHPGAGVYSGTLANALVHRFQTLSSAWGNQRPGLVHRLDKGTTGLILVAKTEQAHQQLADQWKAGAVTKVYQALVWGNPDPTEGEIETLMGRHPRMRRMMAADVADGKWSKSRYKLVESFPEASRVNVHILTGRTHQIRVHMAHIGHPVVGDALYGHNRHRNLAKAFEQMPDHPMLHAALLRFNHPVSGEEMTFKQPPPEAFTLTENALRAFPY